MPGVPNLTELLAWLHGGTDKGTIRWQSTPDDSVFRVTLESGIIRIEQDREGDLSLAILDKQNQRIEDLFTRQPDERDSLKELYKKARWSALNLGTALDAVVKELQKRSG